MGVQERRARQKEGIREEILEAARALFLKEGYEHVSIRKIAERIEYSPGTIYLYFRDKADILEQICEEMFSRLQKKLAAINADKAGNALDRLRRGLRVYIQFGLENPHHYALTFSSFGHMPKPEDFLECTAGGRCFGELILSVTAAMEAGLIEAGDVAEISQALWAAVHGLTSLLITGNGFPFVEQNRLMDRLLDTLMEGIRKK